MVLRANSYLMKIINNTNMNKITIVTSLFEDLILLSFKTVVVVGDEYISLFDGEHS